MLELIYQKFIFKLERKKLFDLLQKLRIKQIYNDYVHCNGFELILYLFQFCLSHNG